MWPLYSMLYVARFEDPGAYAGVHDWLIEHDAGRTLVSVVRYLWRLNTNRPWAHREARRLRGFATRLWGAEAGAKLYYLAVGTRSEQDWSIENGD